MKRSFSILILTFFSVSANAACTEKSFLEFFLRFSNNAGFSLERTQWPLRVTSEQFGSPETRQAKFIKSGREYWGTEVLVSDFLKSNPNMRIYVDTEKKSEVVLTFGIEDADTVFDMKFAKRNGCWKLEEIRDFER